MQSSGKEKRKRGRQEIIEIGEENKPSEDFLEKHKSRSCGLENPEYLASLNAKSPPHLCALLFSLLNFSHA